MYNEVFYFNARFPNRSKSDQNEKKDYMHRKNNDYKEEGKKSCCVTTEEKDVVEATYIAIKKYLDGERYGSETSLISHVSKNDFFGNMAM